MVQLLREMGATGKNDYKQTHSPEIGVETRVKGEAMGILTPTTLEVYSSFSQEAVASTSTLDALPAIPGHPAADANSGNLRILTDQTTIDAKTLVPLVGAASSGKRRRESNEAYHYEQQTSYGSERKVKRRVDKDT